VEIREPNALGVELVQMGRFKHGIAVARKITVALVIGDDDDDIGLGRGSGWLNDYSISY
jgi:hypothetical protein